MRIFLPKHNSQRLLRYTSGSFYGRDLKQLSKLAVVSVYQQLKNLFYHNFATVGPFANPKIMGRSP